MNKNVFCFSKKIFFLIVLIFLIILSFSFYKKIITEKKPTSSRAAFDSKKMNKLGNKSNCGGKNMPCCKNFSCNNEPGLFCYKKNNLCLSLKDDCGQGYNFPCCADIIQKDGGDFELKIKNMNCKYEPLKCAIAIKKESYLQKESIPTTYIKDIANIAKSTWGENLSIIHKDVNFLYRFLIEYTSCKPDPKTTCGYFGQSCCENRKCYESDTYCSLDSVSSNGVCLKKPGVTITKKATISPNKNTTIGPNQTTPAPSNFDL